MDKRYELYCATNPLFYDSPGRRADGGRDPAFASPRLPKGWDQVVKDEWMVCVPAENASPPRQGWKIHVSACLDNAEDVLAIASDYCVDRGVSFKFLRTRFILHMRNAKYAPRGGSGKFITIYPADDAELEVILTELGGRLAGQPGPYDVVHD